MSRIIRLRAENFKRLRAVEITPDGSTVVLTGRNAQGKSSILDAIQATIAGRAGAKETIRPIRDGETKASVEVTLDDLVVTRKWTPTGSTLTVTGRDGKTRFNSPQTVLDDLIGKLAFDPLAFATADAKTQLQTLVDLADLGFDPQLLKANRQQAYDERTNVNRDVKRLQAHADELEQGFDSRTPDVEVDVADIARRLADLNTARASLVGFREEYKRNADEIDRLTARNDEIAAKSEEIRAKARSAGEGIDLQGMLDTAQETNTQVRAKALYARVKVDLDEIQARSDALTERITAYDEEKTKGLANAKFPIPGLSFDEEGVLYQDVPFRQASAAERLKVSTAMAMAMNPDLRVICIRDASLLDADNFKAISDLAAEKDYQVWFESIDPRGDAGILIEDGAVA